MTDIEQQIARASETHKSTAILNDAEHVVEPLQIYPFVTSFFRAYSPANRTTYEKAYASKKYAFAKMLIGFTDPPSFGAIMNNGEYFVYWDQSRSRIETWFGMLSEELELDSTSVSVLQDIKKKFKDYFYGLSSGTPVEERNRASALANNSNESAIAYIVVHMFDALDRQYRSFQRQLINAENAELGLKGLSDTERDANMNWVNRMDDFLKKRAEMTTTTSPTSNLILNTVAYFAKHMLAASPLGVEARMPIGVDIDAPAPTARIINVANPRLAGAPAGNRGTARSTTAGTEPPRSRAAAAAPAVPEESIADHYRRIIADFGAHMLELFRAFSFPPVFTLDKTPTFTVEWDGYVNLAYNSFQQMAEARFAYLQNKGMAVGRAPPTWDLDRIYGDPHAAALFAEFVGYKKGVPALTVAPGQYVQRTNATYHYAVNNMSLRFVSLYDHMVRIDSGGRKRGRWP